MRLLKSLSIRNKLVLSSALIVTVSLVFLSWANIRSSRTMAQSLVVNQMTDTVDASARQLNNWANDKSTVLNTAAGYAMLEDPLLALEFATEAGDYLVTYFAWPDKRTLFDPPQDLPPGYDPTSRPWYQQAASATDVVFTPPYETASVTATGGKAIVVTVATPVRENGQLVAVTAGDISLDSVIEGVRAISPTENSFAYLVDQTGAIIAHPDAALTP